MKFFEFNLMYLENILPGKLLFCKISYIKNVSIDINSVMSKNDKKLNSVTYNYLYDIQWIHWEKTQIIL